ncbi:MAG: ABC transporter substrate-binding protein [Candidatus Liptonbacteria bacterium]|nr:ABC transporter substrate-binding protein [Candidatus Liptonbacteria bacterium]
MNKKLIIGLSVVAVILLVIYFSQKGEEISTIKIGVLVPLTGDAASYGESENRAIQIAVQEINSSGGINGKKIELVTEDGKCDPQAGGTAAQKLVNIDKVKIIIGGACSGETLAAAKITEPAEVILISPSASSPKVTEAGDFVFRTYPSDSLAGKVNATYAFKELKAKKVAVFTELTDYAQGLREVYKETFSNLGGQIVSDETYTTGDTDFRTQVLKIKTAKPDVIYVVPQSLTPGVQIFKQLRESGVTAKFTTAEVLLDRQGAKDNAKVLEGVYGVEPAVDYVGNAKAKAFMAAHKAKFAGAEPGSFAANAYDAVYLIKAAVEATGGLDTLKIRDFLYGVKDWPGAIGSITIDQNGDPILGLNVRKILKGEVTDVGPYTP